MWNQRKKIRRPKYSYAPIGSRWAVYHWLEIGDILEVDKVGGLSGIDFYGMPNDLNVDNYHKATVEELIEHFKGKEEI